MQTFLFKTMHAKGELYVHISFKLGKSQNYSFVNLLFYLHKISFIKKC